MWQWIKDKWAKLKAWLWALAGNSKTMLIAYAIEALALLDEMKVIEWSTLLGAERAGRVAAIAGIVMIGLRMVTRNAVSFKPEA